MRRIETLMVLPMFAVLAACGSTPTDNDGNTPPPGGENTIQVSNNAFTPAELAIDPGESVVFTWTAGSNNHNVLADTSATSTLPESPDAPVLLDAPRSFSVTFPSSGTYRYFCGAHGSNPSAGTVSGMSGVIYVGAS